MVGEYGRNISNRAFQHRGKIESKDLIRCYHRSIVVEVAKN